MADLIEVVEKARILLALDGNDFAWSHWADRTEALAEVDKLLLELRMGNLQNLFSMEMLFAPTGAIQETSLDSGWGQIFLDLAKEFDAVVVSLKNR